MVTLFRAMEDTDDIELRMERCVLDDEEINLPSVLAENVSYIVEIKMGQSCQQTFRVVSVKFHPVYL